MSITKLDKPLIIGGKAVYPQTSADQVIMSDGSRLETESGINADTLDGHKAEEFTTKKESEDLLNNSITSLSASGATITYIKGDGSTGSITVQGGSGGDDTGYVHPSYTSRTSDLYKVTVDNQGHVSGTTPVTKEDITTLGIPAQDTTYSAATASTSGLMSATDKAKLDAIQAGATKVTVDTALNSSSTNPVQNKVINAALSGKAPTSHASSATTYGIGTGSNYGHVKLSDSTSSTSAASAGIAASPKAVKSAYDLANTANTLANSLKGNIATAGNVVTPLFAIETQLANNSALEVTAFTAPASGLYFIEAYAYFNDASANGFRLIKIDVAFGEVKQAAYPGTQWVTQNCIAYVAAGQTVKLKIGQNSGATVKTTYGLRYSYIGL